MHTTADEKATMRTKVENKVTMHATTADGK
jgi:hypothetical protein